MMLYGDARVRHDTGDGVALEFLSLARRHGPALPLPRLRLPLHHLRPACPPRPERHPFRHGPPPRPVPPRRSLGSRQGRPAQHPRPYRPRHPPRLRPRPARLRRRNPPDHRPARLTSASRLPAHQRLPVQPLRHPQPLCPPLARREVHLRTARLLPPQPPLLLDGHQGRLRPRHDHPGLQRSRLTSHREEQTLRLRCLDETMNNTMSRRLKRVVLWLAATAVFAVLGAAGLQALLSHLSLRNIPPPGRLVELNGRQVHLLCAGEGSPTVNPRGGCGLASMDVRVRRYCPANASMHLRQTRSWLERARQFAANC